MPRGAKAHSVVPWRIPPPRSTRPQRPKRGHVAKAIGIGEKGLRVGGRRLSGCNAWQSVSNLLNKRATCVEG